MNMKYYRIIVDSSDIKGGIMYAPSNWPYPIARDAENVENWQSLVLELKNGDYRHFNLCIGGANIISNEFKDVLLPFVSNDSAIEFLPVLVKSKDYGDKEFYILHFKKIFDVIDKRNTIYAKGTDVIIKKRLDYYKVRDLDIFNSQPAINDVIVSAKIKKIIKRAKLDFGLEFVPIFCVNTPDSIR